MKWVSRERAVENSQMSGSQISGSQVPGSQMSVLKWRVLKCRILKRRVLKCRSIQKLAFFPVFIVVLLANRLKPARCLLRHIDEPVEHGEAQMDCQLHTVDEPVAEHYAPRNIVAELFVEHKNLCVYIIWIARDRTDTIDIFLVIF